MTAPVVSVVIAARNAAATIEACLRSLAAQTFTAHEVLVVDDGSSDDTGSLARTLGARVIRTSGTGASAARNLGVAATRGHIVAFTDADCTVTPTWLEALVTALETTGAAGVGGPQRNVFPPGISSAEAFDAFFRLASVVSDYTRTGGGARQVPHNASCNSAYRKAAFDEVGGFAAGLWPGEDVDLDLRLRDRGGVLMFVPEAVVHHHRPGTLPWFRRMMRRYGAAERRVVQRHGRTRRIDYLPPVLVAALAAHALYVVPAVRPWLALADLTVVAAGGLALAVTTPARHWVSVVVFAVTAVWSWHLGWWRGPGAEA